MAAASVLTNGAIGSDASRVPVVGARLRLSAFDQDSGRPVAVRVHAVSHGLLGSEQSWLSGTGALDVPLAAGRYRLLVSHGPEWSIFEREVVVQPAQQLELRASLRREVDASAFTGCDLHVHTAHSPDSDLPIDQRAASLLAEDVQFVATTDHNHVTDATRELAQHGIASLPGVEVTSWAPEFGHFNVFPRRTAPAYKRSSGAQLLRELRADPSAFVQINHPRLEHHIGYFALTGFDPEGALPELGFDGLEVWNGYDLARPARRDEVFADWLALIARGVHLVATGGSDSHKLGEPFVGYPRTYVQLPRAEAHNTGKLLAALKAGRGFVSSGPILSVQVEGQAPGDTLLLAPRQATVRVQVVVDAPRWMDLTSIEIWLGRERVHSEAVDNAPLGSPRAQRTLEIPVADQRSLVVVARGERGMEQLLGRRDAAPYAFSNPVWLRRAPPDVAQLSQSRGALVAND